MLLFSCEVARPGLGACGSAPYFPHCVLIERFFVSYKYGRYMCATAGKYNRLGHGDNLRGVSISAAKIPCLVDSSRNLVCPTCSYLYETNLQGPRANPTTDNCYATGAFDYGVCIT